MILYVRVCVCACLCNDISAYICIHKTTPCIAIGQTSQTEATAQPMKREATTIRDAGGSGMGAGNQLSAMARRGKSLHPKWALVAAGGTYNII